MCYQRRSCESNCGSLNICIQFIPWIFLVILFLVIKKAPKHWKRSYDLWHEAKLYIIMGTIRKCDKNYYWRLVLRGTPVKLLSFPELFFPLIINHGTHLQFEFRMQHSYLYLHGNISLFLFLYKSIHVHRCR